MSTDEMVQQEKKIPEFGANIPFVQPAPPRLMRPSGIFARLKAKLARGETFLKAINFAKELLPLQMRSKVTQKSVKLQYGISTRQARAAIRAAKPKKHRSR